ncbi:hypothetical protein BDR06DRAFT_965654 [Suillus hirtellus]|nr:hypothetical protein BDR06DRAFT_965654 [Suillus hirtellus]
MSLYSDGPSLRKPGSPRCDDIEFDHIETSEAPSPDPQESSHDEFTPTKKKNSTVSSYSIRSQTQASLSSTVRSAFKELSFELYQSKPQCLLTQIQEPKLVHIAHVVQRKSEFDDLVLYEYCLGLDYTCFCVDSRQNLLCLTGDWHSTFDGKIWFLLPDIHTLQDVHDHIKTVVAWRKNMKPSQSPPSFKTKWPLSQLKHYTMVAQRKVMTIMRQDKNDPDLEEFHRYPYSTLPWLQCHVPPPFIIINAGPKCNRDDIGRLVEERRPHQPMDKSQEFQRRLTLLCDTWDLFGSAKSDAEAWGQGILDEERSEKLKKRKREQADSEQIPTRLTRSKTRTHSHTPSQPVP